MPYHFHLIRNILKLTYCFPIETPSAPKSDNQAGGCQGPSVLGRVHAAGTNKDLPILPQSLLSSQNGFWQLAKVLALARGLGGVSCHPGKRKGPGDVCRVASVGAEPAQVLTDSQAEQKEASSSFPRALTPTRTQAVSQVSSLTGRKTREPWTQNLRKAWKPSITREGQRLPGIYKISQNADLSPLMEFPGGLN